MTMLESRSQCNKEYYSTYHLLGKLEIPVGKSNGSHHSVPGKLSKRWAVVCNEVTF